MEENTLVLMSGVRSQNEQRKGITTGYNQVYSPATLLATQYWQGAPSKGSSECLLLVSVMCKFVKAVCATRHQVDR